MTNERKQSMSLNVVRSWMHRNGGCPEYSEFADAIAVLCDDWIRNKSDGMDIVASVALDEIAEIVEAMKDL